MSTNFGYFNPTTFTKPKTINFDSGTMVVSNNTAGANIDAAAISKEVLKTIASLNQNQSEVNLDVDKNPLDNIIVNEVVKLLGYRKLSKSDLDYAFAQLQLGQDPSPNFSTEEHIILLTQARDLEYISEADFLFLSGTPSSFWFSKPAEYVKVLTFQMSLPANIPTMDELKSAGLVSFILTTVKENPEVVIDEDLIKLYTEQYINNLLLSSEFIGYDNAQRIYADPTFIMNILDKTTFKYLLYRTKPYLSFITDARINELMSWHSGQYLNIENVFSATQIRLIIDKELDLKNLIFKTLSLTEVTKFFNELATQFKADFAASFTEEKLKGMIETTIDILYPKLTTAQIYQNIATNFAIEITEAKISSIEDYLTNF